MSLTFKEVQKKLKKRDKVTYHALDGDLADLVLGLTEEAGEVAGNLKKMRRHQRNPQLMKKSMKSKLKKLGMSYEEYRKIEQGKELADVIFYVLLIAEKTSTDIDKALTQKFNEVSKDHKVDIKL